MLPKVPNADAQLQQLAGRTFKESEPLVWEKLGDCHFTLGNSKEGLLCYQNAILDNPNPLPSMAVKYYLALLSAGKESEAKREIKKLSLLLPEIKVLEEGNCPEDPFKVPDMAQPGYTVAAMPLFSSPQDEYPARFSTSSLYICANSNPKKFAANRNTEPMAKGFSMWELNVALELKENQKLKGERLDFRQGDELDETGMTHAERTGMTISTRMVEIEVDARTPKAGHPAVSTLFATPMHVNDKYKSAQMPGLKVEEVYPAEPVTKKRVEHAVEMDVINEALLSSSFHPALHPDGNILVFASTRPGNLGGGGSDLYWSRMENGQWSVPQNMGATINTFGKEMFPTFSRAGDLFFSSDGMGGKGGLDIYRSEFNPTLGIWTAPQQLGGEINSAKDDFSMIWVSDTEGRLGSNRGGGEGGVDIWEFRRPKIRVQLQIVADHEVPTDELVVCIFEKGQKDTIHLNHGHVGIVDTMLPLLRGKRLEVLHKGDVFKGISFTTAKQMDAAGNEISNPGVRMESKSMQGRDMRLTLVLDKKNTALVTPPPGSNRDSIPLAGEKESDSTAVEMALFAFEARFWDKETMQPLDRVETKIVFSDHSEGPISFHPASHATLHVPVGDDVQVWCTREGYMPFIHNLSRISQAQHDQLIIDVTMQKGDFRIVHGKVMRVRDGDSSIPESIPFAEVHVVDNFLNGHEAMAPKPTSRIETNLFGEFTFVLPRRNGAEYSIHAAPLGYLPQCKNLSAEYLARNYRSPGDSILMFMFDDAYPLGRENVLIEYGFGKSDIIPISQIQLDRIGFYLKTNPASHVYVQSHTDARGDAAYNLWLSQQRSLAVIRYIVARIPSLSAKSFVPQDFGETKPLNDCLDGVPCTPAAHAKNRRTEILLHPELQSAHQNP